MSVAAATTSWAAQVAQMEPDKFWVLTTALIAGALAAFYFTFRFLYRLRMVEDTPTSRVRSAAQGYVELKGYGDLMPGTPIVSPLTGTRCTWYSYKVEEKVESYDGRGGRRERWRTIDSATSDDLFLLVDDTGHCVVDPEGAEVTPAVKDVWYGTDRQWSPGMARQRGVGGMFGGRYRYTERRMHPGDSLYALGLFRTVGGSEELPAMREEVRELLAEWKRDQAALLARFDSNGDGTIDPEEWDKAREAAKREVQESISARFSQTTNLMSRPEAGRRPYLLSVLSQDDLARRLRLYTAGAGTAFLLAGAAATWMLTSRF